jgi:phosphate:Na+ symporter
MKRLLARFTTNPFAGLVSGTVATTALDSSSVVIIMTIAMVHAGVLTFAQALGIVLGANIGTTIGGQIIAFDVAKYAPAFLLIGLLVHFFGSGDRWKNWGLAVIGAGLIFFGLDHIGSAMEPFKNYAPFIETMKQLSSNPFFGVLLGAGFTVVIQSSSGTMGIVIILASDGDSPAGGCAFNVGRGGGHMRRHPAGEHRPVARCLPDSDFSPSLQPGHSQHWTRLR